MFSDRLHEEVAQDGDARISSPSGRDPSEQQQEGTAPQRRKHVRSKDMQLF
jgi:hypothetical protein